MRSLGILALVLALVVGGSWLLGRSGRGGSPRQADRVERTSAGASNPAASLQDPGVAPQASDDGGLWREEVEPVPALQPGSGRQGKPVWLVRVLAQEDGRPLPGVHTLLEEGYVPQIWVSTTSPPALGAAAGRTSCPCPVTDDDGRVELEASPGEHSTLIVNLMDAVPASRRTLTVPALALGERRELEVRLSTRDDLRWFGRVLDDATGAPLAGASAAWGSGARLGSAVGAADGMLVVEFATWQTTEVEVEVPGYMKRTFVLERGHDGPERAFPVRLVRPAALEVRVRDGHGAPRPRLRVEVTTVETQRLAPLEARAGALRLLEVASVEPQAPFRAEQSTDQDGACSFEDLTPRVSLSVAVRAGIGETQRQSVILQPGETRALEFEVGAGCTVQGSAVDEQGEPMAALDLWRLAYEALPSSPGTIEPEHERGVVDKARTDARGRFVFEGVPTGDWWVGPAPYQRAAGILLLATRVTIPPEERVHTLTLVCRSARSALFIRGQVLGEKGSPAHATVTAVRNGVHVSAESRQGGRYVVGPLERGDWLLHARGRDGISAPSEAVRAEAGRADVILRLTAGGSVFGTVLDERGTRVTGAEVTLSPDENGFSATALSDEDGYFSFDGQTPGIYSLRATSGASAGVFAPLAVEPGWAEARLEVRLALGAELRIRLASGAPDGMVRVSWNDATLVVEELSSRGELRETLPPGAVVVQLLRRAEGEGPVVVEQQRVELRAGETSLVELVGASEPSAPR